MSTLAEQIERVVADLDLGTPSARKGGRRDEWPYVPVVVSNSTAPGGGVGTGQVSQVKGLAYATRAEAVAAAERYIEAQRAILATHLGERQYRALREQYGLPREI